MFWASGDAKAAGALVLALTIDALWGEPCNRFHPVAWLGCFAQKFKQRVFVPSAAPAPHLVAGACLTIATLAVAVGLPMSLIHMLPSVLSLVVGICALKCCFALRALNAAGHRMRAALEHDDMAAAREALRHLCSRSPDELSREELAGATIESLAENLCDSLVAPLFYFCLLGLPGALAYRGLNTLDAMFGYRGRYEWFGKVPARLDDVINLIPSRLTAVLLLLSGGYHKANLASGLRIWKRDARKTQSPNAGHPMAAMAGMLGVKLDKRDAYSLGDAATDLGPEAITRAMRLLTTAGYGFAVLCLIWLGVRSGL